MRATLVFLAAILFPLAAAAQSAPTADTVLLHGKIYTGDPNNFAQAIAVSGKRIVAVGSDASILAMAGRPRKYDLGGALVIPGINDAHTHLGPLPEHLVLSTSVGSTWDEVLAAISWASDESAGDVWILGEIGPHLLRDPRVTAAALDKAAHGRRIRLATPTGHAAIWSSAALDAIHAGTMGDPPGGWFERDSAGRPTGKAFEYAEYLLTQKLADTADDDAAQEAIRNYTQSALMFGITSIQNMSILPWNRFHRAVIRSGSPLRIREIEIVMPAAPAAASHPVKYILDGTPVERGAAISGLYPNSDENGKLNFSTAQITAMLVAAKQSGQPALFHASGDRTIRVLLDAMDAAGVTRQMRVRIEHGDGLSGDLIARAIAAGAVVVQNPSHFAARPLYPAQPPFMLLKTLLAAGVSFAFGSDDAPNPFDDIRAAVTHGAEAISVAQAVDALTRGAAYAEFAENDKGTLAPGKLADLAVLSKDIFKVPPSEIPETRSVMTMIDGKIVFGTLPSPK